MAYTREGTSSYDPVSGMGTQSRSPMDKAYDDLVSAIGESNTRNSKPRSKASDTSKMNPLYKPKASPGPASLNLYGAPKNPPASARTLNLYGAPTPKKDNANTRENRTSGPKSNAANVRENRVSNKPNASNSSTSFNKGGVAGVLKSPEAKKFKDTFKKKGLLPALRGK